MPSAQRPFRAKALAAFAVFKGLGLRVSVYVDSFNLYYRALKGTPYWWLNPLALAESIKDPSDNIESVRFFTARVSPRAGDPDAPKRQEAYFKALRTIPCISFHYGRFLPKTKMRPLASNPAKFVEVLDTEEKGSDVNLAAFLLHDGHLGLFDAAFVISQDSDLLEPIRMVKNDLKKPVGVVWLDGQQASQRFTRAASFIRHATPARLQAAQFADPVMGKNGHLIRKPQGW